MSCMVLAGVAHVLGKAWDAVTAGEYVPSKQSLDVSGAMKDARAEVGFFEPDDGSMIDDWVAVKLKRGELTDFFHSVRKSARSGDPYILHDGVDLAAAYGTEVPAQGGRAWSGYNTKWGLHVFEEKGGVRHLYAHLSKTHIRFGQIRVMTAGEVIGRVGMTGNTTGPHLHYGVLSLRNQRFINPHHYRFMNGTELW